MAVAKRVLIAIPQVTLTEVDKVSAAQGRTRTDFMRQALRDALYKTKLEEARLSAAPDIRHPASM